MANIHFNYLFVYPATAMASHHRQSVTAVARTHPLRCELDVFVFELSIIFGVGRVVIKSQLVDGVSCVCLCVSVYVCVFVSANYN